LHFIKKLTKQCLGTKNNKNFTGRYRY